jgi:uncharacterized protein (TIGR02594 family)
MARIEIHSNVPAASVGLFIALAVNGGGTLVSKVPEGDGEFTLTFSFPDAQEAAAAAPASPGAAVESGAAAPALAATAPATEPRWLTVARAELGQSESEGAADNPRIGAYHASTGGGSTPDSVPWCSSFVNFCIKASGLDGTDSKRARSWSDWGEAAPSDSVEVGAIVVLARGQPPKGHVGFLVGTAGQRLQVLGGNQGDRVSISEFPVQAVVAMRRPTAAMLAQADAGPPGGA